MPAFGSSRRRLAEVLNAAFAQGLLSQQTHSYRVGLLYGPPLIDQQRLIGDLTLRRARRNSILPIRRVSIALAERVRAFIAHKTSQTPLLLALESTDGDQLLIGRDARCDVVLNHPTVSRRHALLTFRDGAWVIKDLASTNGTQVNGVSVVRAAVHCGDVLALGSQALQID